MNQGPSTLGTSSLPCVSLLYHELRPIPGPYSYVLETGLLDMHADLVAQIQTNASQSASSYLTFDNEYASDFEYALPALDSHGQAAGYNQVYPSIPRLQTTPSELTIGRVNVAAQRSADWVFDLLQPRSKELARNATSIQRKGRC